MKAISLWQPWATLMAIGAKTNETRSWSTTHRGPLAIHAAKRWTRAQRDMANHPRFRKTLNAAGIYALDLLPRGALLCVVDLVDVVSSNEIRDVISLDEACFGDYSPDRFIWTTKLLRVLFRPVPLRGHQGLFNIDESHVK